MNASLSRIELSEVSSKQHELWQLDVPTWRLAANADTSSSVFIVIFVSSEEISGPGEDSRRGPVSGCLSRSLSCCCPVRDAGFFSEPTTTTTTTGGAEGGLVQRGFFTCRPVCLSGKKAYLWLLVAVLAFLPLGQVRWPVGIKMALRDKKRGAGGWLLWH